MARRRLTIAEFWELANRRGHDLITIFEERVKCLVCGKRIPKQEGAVRVWGVQRSRYAADNCLDPDGAEDKVPDDHYKYD